MASSTTAGRYRIPGGTRSFYYSVKAKNLPRIYIPSTRPFPSASPLFATLRHLSPSSSPVSRLSCELNPSTLLSNPLHLPLCQAGFLINPSTPLINDRCPSPFYDQRFRSPLIDAGHHGFLTSFFPHPVAGDRVSRADRCALGDDTFLKIRSLSSSSQLFVVRSKWCVRT